MREERPGQSKVDAVEEETGDKGTSGEEKEKEEGGRGFFRGFRVVYSFADRVDVQLMVLGSACCLFLAVVPPIVWWSVGGFVNKEMQNAVETDDVSELAHNCLILSSGMFICAFVMRLSWEFTAVRQVFRIKKAYVSKLLHMDVSWLESRHSGHVASNLHDASDNIMAGISDHIPMSAFLVAYMLATITVCVIINWKVTLIMFSVIPLIILARILFSKWFVSTIDQEAQLEKKIANLVSETYSCIRTVISFGAQKQTINKFDRISHEHSFLAEHRIKSSSVFDSLCQVLMTELVFTAALSFGVYIMAKCEAGKLVGLVVNLLYLCVNSISIGFHIAGMSTAKKDAIKMGEILEEAPSIETDPTLPEPEKRERPTGRGNISFENVSFSYPSRPDVEVLKSISFSLDEGEHVAIVGSSGSGKSTLTALLLRFYDVNSGKIRLGGTDIAHLSPDDIRSECALVSQEPVLFDGTIGDNIRYGRLDATQMDINDAARRVGAWNFISALPEGMKTRVGDRGMQLSGGQKQRLAIARAVIRRPKVIIFDEATSALDKKHEEEVQTALDAAAQGITSIIIAHRLSTIKTADRIIVLDGGRIAEEGAPDELLANENGKFHQLYHGQEEFYRMYHDQVLDMLAESIPKSPVSLSSALSFSVTDLKAAGLDPATQLRAWNRCSLGAHKRLGKSYSVKSTDKSKLSLPVMSRKKSFRADYNYATNAVDVEKRLGEYENYREPRTLKAALALVRKYREGYWTLAGAIPITVIRSAFFLLICFQIAAALQIYESEGEDKKRQELFTVTCLYIALIIIKTIFESVGRYLTAKYAQGFCAFLRLELFRSTLRHGPSFYDDESHAPGKMTHKVVNDTNTISKVLTSKLDLLIPGVVCSVVAIIVAAWISPKLTLVCGFQFPAYIAVRLIQIWQSAKKQRQMLEEERKAANLSTVVLTNMSTIKAYGLQAHFMKVFEDTLRPMKKAMLRQSIVSAFVYACQTSFMYIMITASMSIGSTYIGSGAGDTSIFDFIRVVLLTQIGSNYCSQLVSSVADIGKAKAAGESILGTMNEEPREMDNLTEEGLRPRLHGSIRFEHVEFRYPTRPIVPVLQKLNIGVKAGESIAIVGPSGSGKSSIFALLQRMYTATNGDVKLDGINVRTINPQYLRKVVVSVGQEPTLFSFTIRENIAFGLLESEATKERIENAARVANIHDFIVSLPQGYDTEVGEFGAQLSGGQKQRIAIARAIIREPAVLLLDEATAALDTVSEKIMEGVGAKLLPPDYTKEGKEKTATLQAVQAALEKASKLLAHRLSTIRNVDRILVLVDGSVQEDGTHAELMQKKGLYFEMNQSA